MGGIVSFGISHIWPFVRGYQSLVAKGIATIQLHALDFRGERFQPLFTHDGRKVTFHPNAVTAIQQAIEVTNPDYIVTAVHGSDHWRKGMIRHARPYDFLVPALPQHEMSPDTELVPYDLMLRRTRGDLEWQFDLVRIVQSYCSVPIFHVEAPPPVASEEIMLSKISGLFKEAMHEFGYPTVSHRFKQWWLWTMVAREHCKNLGLHHVSGPPETRDEEGFLAESFHLDGVHGNDDYGELIAQEILRMITCIRTGGRMPVMHDVPTGAGLADLADPSRSAESDARTVRGASTIQTRQSTGLTWDPKPAAIARTNRTLSLMLKVKDEPLLMKHWVAYHSEIVGEENLTILDCGSKEPEQLDMLDRWGCRIKVVHYNGYYDHIHNTNANKKIFEDLCSNSEYTAILDADEYIFGIGNGSFSAGQVIDVLKTEDANVYAGTWFWNARPPTALDGDIDWSVPIDFLCEDEHLRAGTVAGKSIVRSSRVFDVCHLGHNLQVKEVVAHMTTRSFGRIGIFHLQDLGTNLNRVRIGMHLRSRGVIPEDMTSEIEIIAFLKQAFDQNRISPRDVAYAKRFIDGSSVSTSATVFQATLAIGHTLQQDPRFMAAIESFHFDTVLENARTRLELA